jgi:hypothetical protein
MSRKKFKWTVEIEVTENWVADGFEVHDAILKQAIQNYLLPYSFDHEIKVKVLTAPNPEQIKLIQGHEGYYEPSLYTVCRVTTKNKESDLYGPIHGSNNAETTLCGKTITHNGRWEILTNNYKGRIECKECKKKARKEKIAIEQCNPGTPGDWS